MKNPQPSVAIAATLIMSSLFSNAFAVDSAESTSISVNPSFNLFKGNLEENAIGATVSTNTIVVKNISSTPLVIGGLSISGPAASQFQLASDGCSSVNIAANSSCNVSVSYSPVSSATVSKEQKQALLNIPSDSADTPLLQAFLTTKEDIKHESTRRLPPVLHSLNIPETMTSGQTYALEWSLRGYHDSYITSLVMFDCTGVTDDSCGNDFTSASLFFNTQGVLAHEKVATELTHGGISAQEFKFKTEFTPSFTQETEIVVRFFRINTDDVSAGLGGLTLIAPGNLSDEYYDKEGRRIKKRIVP